MGVSGQRHALAALYPLGKDPGTHWIGSWVGPRAGLDAGARRKILCLCRGSNLDRPIVQPVVLSIRIVKNYQVFVGRRSGNKVFKNNDIT
jgi:hypothetical protein